MDAHIEVASLKARLGASEARADAAVTEKKALEAELRASTAQLIQKVDSNFQASAKRRGYQRLCDGISLPPDIVCI